MTPFEAPQTSHFNLPKFWQSLLTPCLPLLADECGISIIATQQAFPILLKAIYYQSIKIAHTPSRFDTLLTPFGKNTLAEVGINFKNIVLLRPKVSQFFPNFFSDTTSFWAVIGMASERTHVHPQQLADLAQWLSFLVWQSMAHLQKITNISTAQLIEDLLATDNLPPDRLLIDIILMGAAIKPTAFLFLKTRINQNDSDSQTLWETHKTALQQYQASQPFSIVPRPALVIENSPTTPTRQTLPHKSYIPISYQKANKEKSTTDIFIKNSDSNPPLPKALQKHWIAFTVGLSALVIGGIGTISTNNKPAFDNNPIAVPKPADIPHDVAIVRTPAISSPASTASPSKKLVAHPPANQSKTAEKQDMHKKIPAIHQHQTKDKTKKNPPSTAKENTANDTTHTVKTAKPVSSSPKKPLKKPEDDD